MLAITPPQPCGACGHCEAPHVTLGDTWTYQTGKELRGVLRTSHVTTTVVRIDPRYLAVETHTAGMTAPGPDQLVGPDWSRMRSVNGPETVVNRPFLYPLRPGKSWTVDYTELNPNRAHTQERFSTVYRVIGWEDINVPAGTFHALRVDGEGNWTAILPPSTVIARGQTPNGASISVQNTQGSRVASGRLMKSFWYVPDVARWVKSTEEYYSSNGTLTERDTTDLEAYTVAEPSSESKADAPVSEAEPAPVLKPHKTARHHVPAHHPVQPASKPPSLPDGMEQTALPLAPGLRIQVNVIERRGFRRGSLGSSLRIFFVA